MCSILYFKSNHHISLKYFSVCRMNLNTVQIIKKSSNTELAKHDYVLKMKIHTNELQSLDTADSILNALEGHKIFG